VAADSRPADPFRMRRDRRRLASGRQRTPDDVGRVAELFADIKKALPVGRPHWGRILADEVGEPVRVAAVGTANPDIIIGRSPIAFSIPGAGTAHVGDTISLWREHTILALGGGDAANAAALYWNSKKLGVI